MARRRPRLARTARVARRQRSSRPTSGSGKPAQPTAFRGAGVHERCVGSVKVRLDIFEPTTPFVGERLRSLRPTAQVRAVSMHPPSIDLDTTLRRLAILVGLAAAIPLRSRDLDSHPFPAVDYRVAITRVEHQQAVDDRVAAPAGRTLLLTHGTRSPRVDVLLHGFTDSPAQFAELADSLYHGGDNVYVPR